MTLPGELGMKPVTTTDIEEKMNRRNVYLRIPSHTIFKILATAIVCYVLYELMPFLMLLFMSVLLAVTFAPLADRLTKWIGRTAAVLSVAALIGLSLVLIGFLVVPAVIEQTTALYHQIPAFASRMSTQFPPLAPLIKHLPQKITNADPGAVSPILSQIATIGGLAVDALSSIALIYVFMVYLLFDGARTYAWLLAFFKIKSRRKLEETGAGVAPVISAYVIGQIITSVLCSLFTYAALSFIGVPAAAVLAVMAGIFDILPIIGFFMFAIPSALFALTVSPSAALIVVGLFLVYHLLETYVISPLVYGNRLRVSGIVVLFSLVTGALIGGILGAIAILPVVASYPVIEKIWLADFLGQRVINKHDKISSEKEGDQKSPVAIVEGQAQPKGAAATLPTPNSSATGQTRPQTT
jgi:predicted PurR-regulated permease PerM